VRRCERGLGRGLAAGQTRRKDRLRPGFLLLIVAVAIAKGLRSEPSVQHFIARHSGTVEPSHPEASSGFPAWLRVEHFFNVFLLIFIVRAGVQILSDHLMGGVRRGRA
jgi:hypothetical protein